MALIEAAAVQPYGDRVLVKTILETETETGIIIPEMSQGRPERAIVVAVGPGKRNPKTGEMIPVGVEPGEEVYFNRIAGTHVPVQEDPAARQHILFRGTEDIFAVVRE